MTSIRDLKKITQRRLKAQGEPTKCGRCGGGPGDPGCGKIIHIILDAALEEVERQDREMKESK